VAHRRPHSFYGYVADRSRFLQVTLHTTTGDWLTIAEKDLNRVRLLLGQNDPELAGFCGKNVQLRVAQISFFSTKIALRV
jgi:hypothetical protein